MTKDTPFASKTARGASLTTASFKSFVRPLEAKDLEEVARLFLLRFRQKGAERNAPAIERIGQYMKELYLDGLNCEDGPESLVYVNARGELGAFVGVVNTTFLIDGKPIRTAEQGALMSSPEAGNESGVLRILRELARRPFELLFTDTANRSSLAIGQALKYRVLSPQSLEWVYAFNPAAMVLHNISKRWPMTPKAALQPLAKAADVALKRALRKKQIRAEIDQSQDVEVDPVTFATLAPMFLSQYRLRPEWSAREFAWLANQASSQKGGSPLHLRQVSNSSGETIGCYAFYGEKGGVAQVLHVGAKSKAWSTLLAHILNTTEALGCIGAHGSSQEALMPVLYAFPGMFFYYAGGVLAFSNRPQVLSAIEERSVFLGGFAGDRWTRFSTDGFGVR
jgi:hypothetical protein